MDQNNSYIKKLFYEKKFLELIHFIENQIKDKSSRHLNILGVTRLLYEKNKDSFQLALSDFKLSYLKEKHSEIGLEAFINYINASVDYYDLLNQTRSFKDHETFFNETLELYNEVKKKISYNSKLFYALARVYKRLNKFEETSHHYNLLYKNKDLNLTGVTSWVFFNNYLKNWRQQDYFYYSKLLNFYSKKYPTEELTPVLANKNHKIKIGFLSADILRRHSITNFLKTILLNYDKDKFEIYLFLNHPKIFDDETTQDFKKLVSKYFYIDCLNDIEVINLVRNENIDIMFDLMGLTSSHRTSLFKNRLAPVQITWLGYCNTTGLNEMDYLIADPNLIYPEEEKYYAENIIYMPNIWSCHSGFSFKPNTHNPPCLKNNFITFGSFNNFAKINKDVVYTWSKVLQNIKGSKLILKSSVRVRTSELKKMFQDFGVLNSVVFLENEASFERHLNLYNEIDIALDTFPYNGVTTSFEALWMGVPVITMRGYNFNSRCGESIIKNTKIDYLIASNKSEYVQKAIYLANNIKELLKIRKKLFNTVLSTPLFDTKSFAKEFEDTLINIFKK